VIGVNVTRGMHRLNNMPQQAQRIDRFNNLSAKVVDEAHAALVTCEESSAGDAMALSFYIGGPVAPTVGHALALVTNEGAMVLFFSV